MIVIAISSTNCFPLIGVDGFHGLCRAAAISHGPEIQQNPPSITAPWWDEAGAGRRMKCVSEGALLSEGLLAKEKKKKIL